MYIYAYNCFTCNHPKDNRYFKYIYIQKDFYGQINVIQSKFLWIILFEIIMVTISAYISIVIHKHKTIMYE